MKPLVSILIPTYNRPAFFAQALLSAYNQTYEHIEIIICDNSEGNETAKIVEALAPHFAAPARYYKNEVNMGPLKNMNKCLELSKGEFINYLMDDDLFSAQKIEKMMHYFFNHKDISLVTSHRLTIDKNGSVLRLRRAARQLFKADTILPGRKLAEIMLKARVNYTGEPTTVLFKKSCLDEPFGEYCGRKALFSTDLSSWFHLLEKGNAVYMAESLSFFRIHETQWSNEPGVAAENKKDWDEYMNLWLGKYGHFC